MSWFDWILIVPVILGVLFGYRMGLIKNVLYIILVAITMVLGGWLSQLIVEGIGLELESEALVTAIGYALLLILGFILVQIFNGVINKILGMITFGVGDKVNQIGGLFAGLIMGFLVMTIMVNITARWTYASEEDQTGKLEISEAALTKMFQNSLENTSREAGDLILRESIMVGVVIDTKNLLGGSFLGLIPGQFKDALDIAEARRDQDG